MENKRNSSIELLRIIAMVGIFLSHWSIHGLQLSLHLGTDYINNTIFTSLHMLGKIGVDVFVLISGYFLCSDNYKIKFKKIILILLQVLIYSILWVCIDLILYAVGLIQFSEIDFYRTILPLITNDYWFVVVYLFLLICSPLINLLINKITKKQHSLINLILLLILTISTFFNGFLYDRYILFIFLYLVSGYFRKYGINELLNRKKAIMALILSLLVGIGSIPLSIYFGINQFKFIEQNSFIIFLIALSLFLIFIQIKLDSKIINSLSKTMFGIYLFHDGAFRNILWRVLGTSQYTIHSNAGILLLNLLFATIIVFGLGIPFEYLRINTIEKSANKLLKKAKIN